MSPDRTRTLADTPPSVVVPDPRRWAVLAVLCLTLLITSLDGTVLNVALPTIVTDLHTSSSQLQWMVDAYIIVFAGLLLIAGSIGDHVGRKWVYVAGIALFTLGSAASAFSRSSTELISARGFMGIGAAAIMPSTLSILTNVFTVPEQRARAIGLWSGVNGLGLAIGPVVGGWLLAHFWWGSVFLINVPIGIAACLVALWLVPDSRNREAQPPDVPGAVISLLAIGLLLFGIIEAPSWGWSSSDVLAAVLGAVALSAGFAYWERTTRHPLLEVSLFRRRRFSAAMGGLCLVTFALSGTLFLQTQYLQFCLDYSPLQTGLRIAPIAIVVLAVAATSSFAVRLVGTKVVVFCGTALIAVGLGLLAAVATTTTVYSGLLVPYMILGVGSGLVFAPCTESVMGSVPLELAGVGSATNSTALQIGSALGVAILGSLLNTRYQSDVSAALHALPIPAAVLAVVRSSLGGALEAARAMGGTSGAHVAAAARRSFVTGMDFSVTVGSVMAGGSSIVMLALLPARATSPRD